MGAKCATLVLEDEHDDNNHHTDDANDGQHDGAAPMDLASPSRVAAAPCSTVEGDKFFAPDEDEFVLLPPALEPLARDHIATPNPTLLIPHVVDPRVEPPVVYRVLGLLGKGAFAETFLLRKRTRVPLGWCAPCCATSTTAVTENEENEYGDGGDDGDDDTDLASRTQLVAGKRVLEDATTTDAAMSAFDEFILHKRVSKHPQIVQALDFFVSLANERWLVLEYCRGGSLAAWLEQQRGGGGGGSARATLTPAEAAQVTRDVVAACDFLHREHKVVHADIKPANLLLLCDHIPFATAARRPAEHFRVKLGDFGLAVCQGPHSVVGPEGYGGTPNYSAPELVLPPFKGVSPASDVWAIGVTAYRLLVGQAPYKVRPPDNKGRGGEMLETKRYRQALRELPPTAMDFLRQTVRVSVHARQSCQRLLKHHPFLQLNDRSQTATPTHTGHTLTG